MHRLALAVLAFLLLVPARTFASEDALGGPGESCRSRSDCRAGLKCVSLTCIDPNEGTSCQATSDCGGQLACVRQKCVVRNGQPGPMSARQTAGRVEDTEAADDKPSFELTGAHAFLGITSVGGPTSLGVANDRRFALDDTVQGSALVALRVGVMFGRNELAAEISPGTYVYYANTRGGSFQFNVTYGHYLPLHEGRKVSVYWPLRIGAGLFTGNTDGLGFFQGRADLFGIALRFGHVMVDFHVPSFRYAVSNAPYVSGNGLATASLHLFSWELGTSVTYVF